MTAVDAERDAVIRGLHRSTPDVQCKFEVHLAGVGPASAAASTARIVATSPFDLVISTGIGGGFKDHANIGSLVIADQVIAADLGAEHPQDIFTSVDKLGFGSSVIPVHHELSKRLFDKLSTEEHISVYFGPILTLSTVTGTSRTADILTARIPGAAAEAMEGYGVAIAAQQAGIPVMELRTISNAVGPRQRELWRVGDALQTLEHVFSILPDLFVEVTTS
ncbi:Futalosine hydrolase [compost metagenome]